MNKKGDSRIRVVFVVDGDRVDEAVSLKRPIKSVVHHVLAKTGNTGQPLNRWELKTKDGQPISMDLTFEGAGIRDGDTLFLSPRVGRGG